MNRIKRLMKAWPEPALARGGVVATHQRVAGEEGCTYTIQINGAADPRRAAEEIHRLLLKRKRETGRDLGLH